jgi:hypothetical protein
MLGHGPLVTTQERDERDDDVSRHVECSEPAYPLIPRLFTGSEESDRDSGLRRTALGLKTCTRGAIPSLRREPRYGGLCKNVERSRSAYPIFAPSAP